MRLTAIYISAFLLLFSSCHKVFVRKLSKKEVHGISERDFVEGMKFYVNGSYAEALTHFESAYKRTPDNAGICYMIGKIHYKANNYQQALHYSQKALKLDSKNPYYYQQLAEVYEKQQNYTEAAKTLKKLITEVPVNEDYYFELADLYLFEKDYEEALKIFSKIESTFGKSPEVCYRKQQIYIQMGKLDLAVAEGQALINTFPDEPEYKLRLAEMLFTNNKTDEALSLVQEVIKEDPENPYAHYILSSIYKSKKENALSNAELDYVFKNPDMDLDIKLDLLQELTRSSSEEDKKSAVRLAEYMLKAHPNEAKAYSSYGDLLLMEGNKEQALNQYLLAKKIDGNNFALWTQIINLDIELNKPDSLIRHSEQALELFPNQSTLWLYNGTGYYQKKNYARALESYEEGKKLSAANPEIQLEFNLRLADTYHEIKEYKKSDEAFDAVLKADPNNEHALNNYSYFLSLRNEKLELAKEMSGRLIKRSPDPSYLDTYAWVLYKLKEYEEAKKYLEMALKTNNGTIIEHYGDVLYKLGQTEQAVQEWKKAKAAGETSEYIDKKIADKKLYE
ncbi:MAG: tetratricopeptide repeat protein [Cytophagaceae bacterium]